MQPTFTEIKSAAKSALKHRWPEAIAVSLICVTTVLLDSVIQDIFMRVFKVSTVWSPLSPTDVPTYDIAASVGITVFSAMFSLVLTFPLVFGVLRWFWLVTGGSDPTLSEIFHYFGSARLFFKTLALSLILYLLLVFGAIVSFAPYIIVDKLTSPDIYDRLGVQMPVFMDSMRPLVKVFEVFGFLALMMWSSNFALAYTIVFSEPELSVFRTVGRALKVARGLRFNFVGFLFSFFGWMLAGLLILPLVFIVPYFISSLAVYGREALRTAHRKETAI